LLEDNNIAPYIFNSVIAVPTLSTNKCSTSGRLNKPYQMMKPEISVKSKGERI